MSTLLDKIWEAHLVRAAEHGPDLLYVDRHLIHEVTSPQAFLALERAQRKVRRPDLTFAAIDHVVPTAGPRELPLADPEATGQIQALRDSCAQHGIFLLDVHDPRQGIVHVVMPELGITLPGQTIFCGDSHTATHGALGALAFGVGTSEVEHILATQTLPQKKPETLGVKIEGRAPAGVSAKDLILAVIAGLGVAGGTGKVIEYYGKAVSDLTIEGRMTLCNMSIECGARAGMVAPDAKTLAWVKGRPFAPTGDDWDQAAAEWAELKTDQESEYDHHFRLEAKKLEPMVTWGTNPGQGVAITGVVPEPASSADRDAQAYMDLTPGTKMAEVPINWVFIGSCTNGRLEDLRAAAAVIKGKKKADHVTAIVVPGSGAVKRAAEAEGLDQVFLAAGLEWRDPGCSMCLAMNPDILSHGDRCASTSNRNFQDRQGHGARTHLVSPATAAASAVAGRLADPRG